jgi:sigma-E factor negative regulatory protein RseA
MERISALMDGESDRSEVAQVVRQMREQEALRETWSTYHLIGDAMRGERCTDTRVAQGVSAKLAAEPTVLAPRRGIGDTMRRMALPSMAAAAAVATVTWVSLETYQPSRSPVQVVVPLAPIAGPEPLGSLIQHASVDLPPPQIQLHSRPIDAYIEAHQEFSPSRTIQGLVPYARTVSATGSVQSGR